MESTSKRNEDEEKKRKVEEARRLKAEEEARRLKAEEDRRKSLEQETLAAENRIKELKRLAEEEAKNLELIKETKRLEQLQLEEMRRKNTATALPPQAPHSSESGKDFKYEIPDNVEIKGAIELSVRRGVSDQSLDGLYSGSFFKKDGFKIEKRNVIIKESLASRHRNISHEADVYQYLSGKGGGGCIELYGFNKTSIPSFIVLEDFGEDLRSYIHSSTSHEIKRLILKKCIEALHSLHSMSVMHGDLKPANILVRVGHDVLVKLCDLDSARILSDSDIFPYDQSSGHLKFTESWVAPEVYQNNKICAGGKFKGSLAIDIFNLGMIAVLLESKGYTTDVVLPLPGTDDYDKALTDQSFLDSRVLKLDNNNPYRDILMRMCR